MFNIYKITNGSPIDYAAEELRKYLKMMMPDEGNFEVSFDKEATDGYRLGVMADFGLDTSDAEDTELDDIIYIDTKGKCGIIAGSNPRSVLIAVYEYLRQNGCEWVMPGIDGEIIPMHDVFDVKYRYKPSMRYRGWVSEGTEFQRSMVEAVEYAPKLGLNVFMIEMKVPKSNYERYYCHDNNPARIPEPVGDATLLQWKRMLEAEIQKRGLQFHDMGHGFTYEPIGIPGESGWDTEYDKKLTPEQREMIAMINGKREICYYPINTNLCMSNPRARKKVVEYVVDYAKHHSNVDYLHVWLADANNNHCECEECVKKLPTDFYVMMMNDIDEALTEAGLKTRIVFIAYMDSAWAPLEEKIKNPDRFILMIAPITRKYTETLPNGIDTNLAPFERNKLQMPRTLGQFFGHLKEWERSFNGSKISFEYHFWRAMWYDISGIKIAEVMNEDVREYLRQNINGILEDGSQRCFMPTGLCFYTFARTCYDSSLTAEQLRNHYFGLLFGDYADEVESYLLALADAFDFEYMAGLKPSDVNVSRFYNPEHAKSLAKVEDIYASGKEMILKHFDSELRPRTVAMRVLYAYNELVRLLARAMIEKANGRDDAAKAVYNEMKSEIGKYEAEIEQYYDQGLALNAFRVIFEYTKSNLPQVDYMDVDG